MADLPPSEPGEGPRVAPDRASPPRTPRWVKASGIIAAVLVVAFVILTLAGGEHGPNRHSPEDGNPGGHSPPVQHSP